MWLYVCLSVYTVGVIFLLAGAWMWPAMVAIVPIALIGEGIEKRICRRREIQDTRIQPPPETRTPPETDYRHMNCSACGRPVTGDTNAPGIQ